MEIFTSTETYSDQFTKIGKLLVQDEKLNFFYLLVLKNVSVFLDKQGPVFYSNCRK